MDLKRKLAQLEHAPAERERTLSDLREQMAALMQRKPAKTPAVLPSAVPPLDFVALETEHGTLHHRTRFWNAQHWIGCVPVQAALHASAEYWALLGLDPRLAGSQPGHALYLDIETTGLSAGAGVLAFLVGLAWFEQERLVLEQLFLCSPAEEPAQLSWLMERICACSLLVTFNGKSFDWPMLANRYVMNHLELPRFERHLDLLHVARRLHRPRMGRVNLRALEVEVLGLDRGPDIDGAEIGPRYAHFLRTQDEEALRPVIEHNAVDVLSMVALAGLYGEPLDRISDADLVPLGWVFKRARDLDKARAAVERAMQADASNEALRLRAELAKARGDRDAALADFEQLCESVDEPELRLALAKLYEHHLKRPDRALDLVERGTGESDEAAERRKARLKRKALTLRSH